MNAHDFTESLQQVLPETLTARPYNRFEPADSLWWLIPGKNWPAYNHGKIFVKPVDDVFECGLYLEKGNGDDMMQVPGTPAGRQTQVMDTTWMYPQWIQAVLADSEFSDALVGVSHEGFELHLRWEIFPHNGDPSDPSSKEMMAASKLHFVFNPDTEDFGLVTSDISPSEEYLSKVVRSSDGHMTMRQFAAVLELYPQADWAWFDLMFYVEADTVNGSLLRALEYFKPWVR